jgi:hypothetical protein
MAEDKKSFVLYADLIHTVKKMPKEKQGELFMTILSYVNDENPIVEDLLIDLVFEPIKRQMKRDLNKYHISKEKRREAGRLAGLKSGEARKVIVPETNQIQPIRTNGSKNEPNEHVTVNDTVNDTVTVTVTVNDTDTDILLEKETKEDIVEASPKTKKFNFRKALFDYGFNQELVDEWLIVRKNKNASNTQTAFKAFITEIESRECNYNEMLVECVKNSWSGFKHVWIDNQKTNNNGNTNNNQPKPIDERWESINTKVDKYFS